MRPNRSTAVLATTLLALTLTPAALAAQPDDERTITTRSAEDRGKSAEAPSKQPAEPAPAATPPGKPRNDVIEDVPTNPDDASIPLNLTPYHAIPPKLRELQQSDRISVEIIGESLRGRDLHLAVATSPMSDAEWNDWQRLSDLRTDDPDAAIAALEAGEYDDWKSPLFINNNIHGNEWEGTDASLQVLNELATSDDAEITRLLDEHVIAFVITNNPDGRVAGTRQNAAGFDLNRDYVTQSQPESRAVKTHLSRYNPLTMLDQHGYTGTTLIEPTTGPHGENYEYDLYIRQALRNGLAMEEAVLGLNEPRVSAVNIPYRDFTDGWDDWPPIFTPMYAMYHGAVGHTVEFPLNARGISDVAERHERTRINTAVSRATIEANFEWSNANQESLLADQLELFRRGE
ncbi:MAG: peptidase M28, partial [Actinophytocola sp.]|nr:peptidase M28 [Actinophytocola sp.]